MISNDPRRLRFQKLRVGLTFNSVSSMETEHFPAPFRVISLGSFQIENNQIEKPSTKALSTRIRFYIVFIEAANFSLRFHLASIAKRIENDDNFH